LDTIGQAAPTQTTVPETTEFAAPIGRMAASKSSKSTKRRFLVSLFTIGAAPLLLLDELLLLLEELVADEAEEPANVNKTVNHCVG
jgi:hypothetical protein